MVFDLILCNLIATEFFPAVVWKGRSVMVEKGTEEHSDTDFEGRSCHELQHTG